MKLRVPDGCCGASLAGNALEISEVASVEVEEGIAAALLSHGFTRFDGGPKSANLPAMDSDEAASHGLNNAGKAGRERNPGKSPTARAEVPPPTVTNPASGSITPSPIAGTGDISSLNRRGLFALLRAKRVPVSLPITNDELRALARRACAG